MPSVAGNKLRLDIWTPPWCSSALQVNLLKRPAVVARDPWCLTRIIWRPGSMASALK